MTTPRCHLVLILALLTALSACDDGSTTTADAAGDAVTDLPPVQPLLDPGVLAAPTDDTFFDFPYPSDLRTLEGGFPDLTGFPRSSLPLVSRAVGIISEDRPGFSPLTGVYFRFDGPLDPASLPAPEDTLGADAALFFIDIDPDSERRGTRYPAYTAFQAEGSNFWSDNTLSMRAVPGLQLRPSTTYAAVILDGQLLAADGDPVEPAAAIAGGTGDPTVDAHLASLTADLAAEGVPTERLITVAAFTTSDPVSQLDRLREDIHSAPAFTVSSWEREEVVGAPYVAYRGTFTTREYFSGESPYNRNLGDGRFQFDAQGAPIGATDDVPVRFTVTVPASGEMPASGYPLVIYGHGTGGGAESHVDGNGEGAWLATVGVATLGFDAALHGDRVEGNFDVEGLIASNVIGARESVRQTVVDMMVLYRLQMAGSLTIPADITGGDPITFDTSAGYYMGHSQGSQEAGLLLAVEPEIDAAFLSAGGGGAIIPIIERKFQGAPIACTVALILNMPCDELTEEHPVATLIIQPLLDPADPIHFAPRFIQEPAPGHTPKHIVMTEGTLDTYTPPRAIEALAAAIGLPIVEPVVRTSAPLEIVGTPSASAPLTENIEGGGGVRVTGGLVQFQGEGHFAIYDVPAARILYVEFFRTAVESGAPTLVSP